MNMRKTILINVFSFILIILFFNHAAAFHSNDKIDETFSHSDLNFYPPIQGRSACYLGGIINNNSGITHENVTITINAYDFFDHYLWHERIYIKIIGPHGKHSFSERMYNCDEPSKFKFEVSGVQQGDKKNEEYLSGSIPKKGELKRVDLISLPLPSEKNKLLNFSILYKNKDRDELIHWEGWPVTCDCVLYENSSTILSPVKGSQILKFNKKLHKSSQDVYVDIPKYYTFNNSTGILECEVNTGFYRLKADSTILFSGYDKKSTVDNNPQRTIQSEPSQNFVTKQQGKDHSVKYEIELTSGRTINAIFYQKEDKNISIYCNDDVKFNVNADSVKEIREINQPKTDTGKSAKENNTIKTAEKPPKETAQKPISEQPNDSSKLPPLSKGVAIVDGISITVGTIEKTGIGSTFLYWQVQNETDQIVEFDIKSYVVVDGRQYEDSLRGNYKIMPNATAQNPLFSLPMDDPNKLFEASDVKFSVELGDITRKIKGTATLQFKGHELKRYLKQKK